MVVAEEPKEKLLPGCNAACAVSQAVAIAASKLRKIEPFQHVASLTSAQVRFQFTFNNISDMITNPNHKEFIYSILIVMFFQMFVFVSICGKLSLKPISRQYI